MEISINKKLSTMCHVPCAKTRQGFTLIEVLLVVAIIALLVIALTLSMRGQRQKAEDARAKSDLERLRIAFEDYYNDHNCYPPPEWFDEPSDCHSESLKPYLNTIPCDPRTREPYALEYDDAGCPSWYKLYSTLTYPDPAHCSPSGSGLGNYGIGSSNVVATGLCELPNPSSAPGSSPAPSPPGGYYCQSISSPSGNCTAVSAGYTCTPSFADANCGGTLVVHCSQPAQLGSCVPN